MFPWYEESQIWLNMRKQLLADSFIHIAYSAKTLWQIFSDQGNISPLVKSVYQKSIFLISQPKWDGAFEHTKHMLKLMGKKIFTIVGWKILFI